MILFTLVFAFIASSATATNFSPKYGNPRLPYRRQYGASIPHGLKPGLFGTRPILHPVPLVPTIRTRATWVKKVDPRTGKWVKVMKRKSQPKRINPRDHFARKVHIARKMHKMAKLRSAAQVNTMRGGLLGAPRQPFIHGNFGPGIVPHQIPRTLPHRGTHLNRRTEVPHGFIPQPHRGPMINPRVNSLHGSQMVNGQFHNQLDNTFDDRFDSGFGSAGVGPISNQGNIRGPFVQNSFQQAAPRAFPSPVDFHPHHNGKPTIHHLPNMIGTGNVGGLHGPGSQFIDDSFKHGAHGAIVDSFDRKTTSFKSNTFGNVGVLGSQSSPNVADRRFIPEQPQPPLVRHIQRPLPPLASDPFPGPITGPLPPRQTPGPLPRPLPEHFQSSQTSISVDFGLGRELSDDIFDDRRDDDRDRFSVLERIEDSFESINDNFEFPTDRIESLDEVLDDLRDNNHGGEILSDGFLDSGNDDRSGIAGIAGELMDDLSNFNPLRGVGGESFGDKDDVLEKPDESPIMGLQLLGPSSWDDVLNELQTVGSQDDTRQQLGDGFQVLPINPHSREDMVLSTLTPRHDDMGETHDDFDSVGTLALLGIDPSTIVPFESVIDDGAVTPDHPPPIPLPNGEISVHKQDSLDTQTTMSKTAIKTNDGASTFEQNIQRTLNDAVDTLNTLATIDALKEIVS